MSKAKEIRVKIGSIKNTQKITRAMELVAASKMRKAQDQMSVSRPYATKIRQVISHVAASNPEYQHPYLKQHEHIKRVGYIIVSTDRGLCGGLNINLFRKVLKDIMRWQDRGIAVDICILGRKASGFFKRLNVNIKAAIQQISDQPEIKELVGIVKVMLDEYDQGQLHSVFIASNEFINTMQQQPTIKQLLPLEADQAIEPTHWDYIYEPDSARELLTLLLRRYIESQVYQAVVENIACEQAARMVAMKSATDNAGGIINDLRRAYNKARQAAITKEIAEIVGGAEAIQ